MAHTLVILGVPTLAVSLTIVDAFSPLLAHIMMGVVGLGIGIAGAALMSRAKRI